MPNHVKNGNNKKSKPRSRRRNQPIVIDFASLKPGDSILILGMGRSTIISAFSSYMITGRYALRAENGGFRFYLLKKKDV